MATEENEIVVQVTCDDEDLAVDFDKLKRLAEHICRRFAVTTATVSIAILRDEAIKKVNDEFLDTSDLTDVISFDLSDDGSVSKVFELLINADEADRQGQKRGHSTEAELALYITHGLLHNLGFDDAKKAQACEMHHMEDEILQSGGFGVVYGETEN